MADSVESISAAETQRVVEPGAYVEVGVYPGYLRGEQAQMVITDVRKGPKGPDSPFLYTARVAIIAAGGEVRADTARLEDVVNPDLLDRYMSHLMFGGVFTNSPDN